ncbi:NAD(P)H-hydrate dehydratase [Noviherbaspirillum pedocola]|uniref:Bifunctional NAD(P)H-hydrate repair enzyme n=1 Tax=Noviherbaspirillum pedocola TaxID=2801341 RepID=A0A934SV81_9BURK|nr:NAD(P)H-hydrate dehydratase [Noviherbaspirillum pedocola]MBK4735771.1 NAD(P)H-hydrate dehydratase [Noviherbaspirillum pedocola]
MPDRHALHTVAEIRRIEAAALAATPPGTLMQRAGAAAAAAAARLLRPGGRVLALAGPGNNGGDAMEAAALLANDGFAVTIRLCGDAARLPADASAALRRAQASAARFDADASADNGWDLVIDGLFGIGLARALVADMAMLVAAVNRCRCPVLALDVPSGLDADTGNIVGPGGIAVRASHTVTFIADKPGLHTADGCDYAGRVEVADLDIDAALYPPPTTLLNHPSLFSAHARPRPANSHKGSFGDVAILGGAHGMAGAAVLAARCAAFSGAGRVYAGYLDMPPAFDPMHPEIMCRHAADIDLSRAVIVAGPGFGQETAALAQLMRVLASNAALVLDADALNLIAADSALGAQLAARSQPQLITPHPLEAARLLGLSSAEVQADRLRSARSLAQRYGAVAVLKGAGSVIARPDGFAVINTTGNPALATGGSGDVLSGLCGALLAQGWPAWEAALGAVWLHGAAADWLVREGVGPIGMLAGELIPAIRRTHNRLIYGETSESSAS